MDQIRKVVAPAIMLLCGWTHAHALTPFSTLGDWACADEPERLVVARTLVQIAGQGRPQMQETFFESCIEEAAVGSARFNATTVSAVATECVFMALTVFSESG
jgi:hypothetical protein